MNTKELEYIDINYALKIEHIIAQVRQDQERLSTISSFLKAALVTKAFQDFVDYLVILDYQVGDAYNRLPVGDTVLWCEVTDFKFITFRGEAGTRHGVWGWLVGG